MSDTLIQYGPKGNTKAIEEILDFIFTSNINSPEKTPTPLCLWGTHGLGKTEMIKDYAKNKGWGFEYIAPAQFEEMGDFHGLPYVEGERMLYKKPNWVPDNSKKQGILLLDDFNRADIRIIKGLMQLIQYR